ncbi:hypothetical protein AALP_AA1G053200 [Arabis alpina]|uniref:PGG domain-containing protein n=1 Tax=Arabis alpina TaxID=50452 RepID=A0A087HL99_ARAAL|nr:hypothetical protein AALP_AA1G053200 [Arabis alpina]
MTKLAITLPLIFTLLIIFIDVSTGSSNIFNVVSFGAKPDGVTDSTAAFLKAWQGACSSAASATVLVPTGTFLVKVITFGGPCKSRLKFQVTGTVVAPTDYWAFGNSGYWILFNKVSKFSLVGGTFDARASGFWSCRKSGQNCPPGVRSISFNSANDVIISGVKSMNSQVSHMTLNGCTNVVVRNIKLVAPGDSPNTDGFGIQFSTGVTFTGNTVQTGDDCVAIGPGTRNFVISKLACGPGHGVSIGSLAKVFNEAGVENVTVSSSVFTGTQNGVRIKSWARPSNGFVRNVFFQNLIMKNVQNPIIIDQNYCPSKQGCPTEHSGVKISQVTYKNIQGTSATQQAMKLECSKTSPCTRITLQDIKLTYNKGTPATSFCSNALGTNLGPRFFLLPNTRETKMGSFGSCNGEPPSSSRGKSMEEQQQSLRCIGTENQVRKKSFRVVLERQLSFMNGGSERKKNELPGKRGDSSLHIAARTGNLGNVIELIRGCNGIEELLSKQNLEGETSLYTAAENGHWLVVEEMLKHMDLDTASIAARNGFDPFHIAAKQGHLEALKQLLDTFPNLAMTTDSSCTTALHTAATQGHIDVVNLLLKTDSHLAKIAKNNGKTALHSAARMGHVEVVKSLIGNDAKIGFRTDKKGQTALHMAVKGQNKGVVHELVKPDPAVLSVEDNKGNTPLHIASKKGRAKIVRCLVSFDGINLNAMNKAGDTALDIAEKIGNSELVSILKEAGAATTAKDLGKPQNPAKQLKQTVSDIRHEVQSQLQQSRQTGARVQRIAKRLKKLHINGLNNAINSATVVAVLIATVAFAAIFTIPGQYEEERTIGMLLGEARIANKAPFLVFFIFDSLALFISLAVVVVQTSVVVIEQKAKKKLVFVINKLMWLACLFISVAFVSLSFIVVGKEDILLAICETVIGGTIMLTTIGAMCYCVIMHRIEETKLKSMRKERSKSISSSHMPSESEILKGEFNKRMYAL